MIIPEKLIPEIAGSETVGIERVKVIIDKETGNKQIIREVGDEIIEITVKNSEGHTLGYVNSEEISKLQDQERILEMMGVKISPSITELIQGDKTRKKYYIKFLPPDAKK